MHIQSARVARWPGDHHERLLVAFGSWDGAELVAYLPEAMCERRLHDAELVAASPYGRGDLAPLPEPLAVDDERWQSEGGARVVRIDLFPARERFEREFQWVRLRVRRRS